MILFVCTTLYFSYVNLFLQTEAPEIFLDVKLLAGLTLKAGTKIELPAAINGKPEPKITWNKAENLLRVDKRINIESKPGHSTVTIAESTRSDSGTYIIEAVNTSGRATAVVEVNVLGMIPSKPLPIFLS